MLLNHLCIFQKLFRNQYNKEILIYIIVLLIPYHPLFLIFLSKQADHIGHDVTELILENISPVTGSLRSYKVPCITDHIELLIIASLMSYVAGVRALLGPCQYFPGWTDLKSPGGQKVFMGTKTGQSVIQYGLVQNYQRIQYMAAVIISNIVYVMFRPAGIMYCIYNW